jgi:hypothetical protein
MGNRNRLKKHGSVENHHRGTARRSATKGDHRRDAEGPREDGKQTSPRRHGVHGGRTKTRTKAKSESAEVAETTEKYTDRNRRGAQRDGELVVQRDGENTRMAAGVLWGCLVFFRVDESTEVAEHTEMAESAPCATPSVDRRPMGTPLREREITSRPFRLLICVHPCPSVANPLSGFRVHLGFRYWPRMHADAHG